MGLARHVPVASQVLYALAILAGAWYVLPRAWLAIRRLRPDTNLHMTAAVLGAVGIGDLFEAATVTSGRTARLSAWAAWRGAGTRVSRVGSRRTGWRRG
jgi:Cd2+/Zn2+-exporting ATPase